MRDIPDSSSTLVAEIVHEATGYETISSEPIRGIGRNNAVTIATTPHGQFVVRTNSDSHLFRYQREAWCYEQLQAAHVPTPTVVSCGLRAGCSYSVATYIANSKPIGEDLDRLRVWHTLGSYARRLNQIAPPSAESVAATYFPQAWKEQLVADVDLIFRNDFWIDRNLLSPSQQDQTRSLLLDCASITAPLGVCNFDLTLANAVISNSDYNSMYLLDLEYVNIAPVPHYQLACVAANEGQYSESTRAFYDGYGLDTPTLDTLAPTIARFTLLRLMRATAWARDRFPALLEENLARTAPLLTKLANY
jgi:hypothetical protein